MSSPQDSTVMRAARRRATLPAGWAMAGAAVAFMSFYLAAGVLTPLLVVYREQWRFPASLLTLAFAVYAVGFLAALLTLGSLSDPGSARGTRRPGRLERHVPGRARHRLGHR